MIDQLEAFLRDSEFGVRPGRLPELIRGALDQAPSELSWVLPLRERAEALERSFASATSLRRLPIIADVVTARLRSWSAADFDLDPAAVSPFQLQHLQIVLLLLLSTERTPFEWIDGLPRSLTSLTPGGLVRMARPLASAQRSVASALERVRQPEAAPPVRTAAHAEAAAHARDVPLGFARLVLEEATAHPDGPAAAASALSDLVFLLELPGAIEPSPDALLARGHIYLANLARRLGHIETVGHHHQSALYYFEKPSGPRGAAESERIEALLCLTAARAHLGTEHRQRARPLCREALALIETESPEARVEILLLEARTLSPVAEAREIQQLADEMLGLLDGRSEAPADLLRLEARRCAMQAAWGSVLSTLDHELYHQPTDRPLDDVLGRALENHRKTLRRIGELADLNAPLLFRHEPTTLAFADHLVHLGRSFVLDQPTRAISFLSRAAEHYLAADRSNDLLSILLDLSYPILLDGLPLEAIPDHTIVAQLLGFDHPVRSLYARHLPNAIVEGQQEAIRAHLGRRPGHPYDGTDDDGSEPTN